MEAMSQPAPLSRRLRAADLFEQGWSQSRVARELEVTRTTAMRWHRAWLDQGRAALARSERTGRPRKLARRELSRVLAALPRGTSVDETARIIEERTGVHYHRGHVWRILKSWGWAERSDPGPYVSFADPDGNRLLLFGTRTPPR